MRHRRTLRVTVAVAASLGVHFAAAMVATPSAPPVLVEGGQTAEIAALGSNFEDLLQGADRLQPAGAKAARPVDPLTPEAPQPVPETLRPQPAARPVVAAMPLAFAMSATPVPTGAVPLPASTATAVPAKKPLEAAPSVAPARPAPAQETARVAALTSSHAAETLRSLEEMPPVPVPVARPSQPDNARNRAETSKDRGKKTEPLRTANTALGNADRNARTGHAEGRREAKAKTGGGDKGGKSSRAGNAKASNYPGTVFSKIRRTRQKKADGAGVARIRFSIGPSGALTSVTVAASSGSASVDSVALDHIRRSAPFPPPPAGAQRKFLIPVEVRR